MKLACGDAIPGSLRLAERRRVTWGIDTRGVVVECLWRGGAGCVGGV